MTQKTAPDHALMADLIHCETNVWEALVTGDMARDATALDAAFLGVYPDGVAGRDAHAEQLRAGPTIRRYALDQARVMELGRDHALLSYRAIYQRPATPAEEIMYVTSIWKRDGAGWISVFSQDTPAKAPA